MSGVVWLVGAGPGDPELLTCKAARLIERADVIVHDELVSEEILSLARVDAERRSVGRRAGADPRWPSRASWLRPDGSLAPEIVEAVREGRTVVRLKGGDPTLFGRLSEELSALAGAGLTAQIVPGITAATAAAASLQIPLTERGQSNAVTLATAHLADGIDSEARLHELAATWPRTGTVVLYMGLGRLSTLVRLLVAEGWSEATPAAVVARASWTGERVMVATLATLPERTAELPSPAVIVLGEVVRHADHAYVMTLAAAAE